MSQNAPIGSVREVSGRLWHFADCEFDELRLELRVRGNAVGLEVKPLEVLLQLLLHAGEVVTKDELLESVWPDVMVVDGSLATAISKLRKALGDEERPVIVNVPRVGYRLAVPVHCKMMAGASGAELSLREGDTVPGREHWRLSRRLDAAGSSEVWLAENPKTRESRVFKFASDRAQLKGLKREATLSRFLRESLGERPEFVRVLEWNFNTPPFFLESEYCGANLAEWAEGQGGLSKIALEIRLRVLADVAKAVAAAHEIGVLHKDLKPANVLLVPDANGGLQIKVADFGSASLFEPSRLHALGITNLGFTHTLTPEGQNLTGTLMYLAPEVLAGQSPTVSADVYALGVMLYQLAVGDFRKPLAPGWEAGIENPLVREDIAEAACGDPAHRLNSAAELAERLLNLDRRGVERGEIEEAKKREKIAETKRAEARVRRPWVLVAAVALLAGLAAILSLGVHRRTSSPGPRARTVAVLPFQNVGSDHSIDFLQLALPDEIATTLSYARALSIRPFATTSKYAEPNADLQKAGKEMGVTSVVTGHFLSAGDQLQITLEAVDVENNRVLWRDRLDIATRNMIGMQDQIAAAARGGLAVALGALPLAVPAAAKPLNEEAYDLYLRAAAMPLDVSPNKQAIGMLERSTALDPNYGPAWLELSRRYYVDDHYAGGDEGVVRRDLAAVERVLALDPDNIDAGAGLVVRRVEVGKLAEAYQEAEDLVRRRPDSALIRFSLSYVLRYAGLLPEASKQCEAAFALDPHDLRSCAVVYVMNGDYSRAQDYIHLDRGSDWAKALSIDTLLRQGKEQEALQIGSPHIPQWGSYDMLLACAGHRPVEEIAALASAVQPAEDPETNYFVAGHLSYCGQTAPALQMLKRAVQGNYCSYPAMDSDPLLASLRAQPEFPEIRSAAIKCQNDFLVQSRQH